MPVRRHLLAQAIVLLHAVPVWPMKFMGHPSESEHRPVRDSPASPRDQTTSTIKQAGSLSTISRNQPYYDSLFVLAPDASLELTRAFNGLARTRKSCFMNVDYDPRILTEGGCPSGGVYLSQQPPKRDAAEAVRVLAQTLKRGHSEGASTTTSTAETSAEQVRTTSIAAAAASSNSQSNRPTNNAVEGNIPSIEQKNGGGSGDCRVVLATRDPRDMLVAHFFAAKHLADIADQTAAAAAAAASTSSSATTTSTASSSTSNSSQVKVVAPAVQNTFSSLSPSAAAKKAPTVATPKITEPPKGPPGGLGAARPKRLRGGLAPEAAAAEMQKRVAEAQKWRALGVDAYALAHASAFTGLEERMLVAKHSFEQSGCQVHLSVFEEMVTEPERWAQKLATFLGISTNHSSSSTTDSNDGSINSSGTEVGSAPIGSSSSSGGGGSGRRHSRGGGHASSSSTSSSTRSLATAAADAESSKIAIQQFQAAQWQHLTNVAASFRKQVDKEHNHFVGSYVTHLAPITTDKLAAIRTAASNEAIKLASSVARKTTADASTRDSTDSSQFSTAPVLASSTAAKIGTSTLSTGSGLSPNLRRNYNLQDDAAITNSRRIGIEAARNNMRTSWRGGGGGGSNQHASSSYGSSSSESWAAYGAIVKQAVASHGSTQKATVVNKGKLNPVSAAAATAAAASGGSDGASALSPPSRASVPPAKQMNSNTKNSALSRLGPRVPPPPPSSVLPSAGPSVSAAPEDRQPLKESRSDAGSNSKKFSSILGRLGGKNAAPSDSVRGSSAANTPHAANVKGIHPAWGFR